MNRLIKSITTLMLAVASLAFVGCDDDESVIGLDDSAKYGNIKLTFDGERPDDQPFTATKNFRFMPSDGPDESSEVDMSNPSNVIFRVGRLLDPFEAIESSNSYAFIYLNVDMSGDEPEILGGSYLDFSATFISSDETFFNWSNDFSLSADDVTSFSYNESNGKLTVKFTTVVNGPNGEDLEITGEVRVTVYKPFFLG